MMSGQYAQGTNVSAERSQAEIQNTLRRFGANRLMIGVDDEEHTAMIGFQRGDRQYRVQVRMPSPDQFEKSPKGRTRTAAVKYKAYNQELRRRWRTLANGVKAMLALAEDGLIPVEELLLPFTMLPEGGTVADHVLPDLEIAAKAGELPELNLLPGLGETGK